jgi:ankyrin repeat protein
LSTKEKINSDLINAAEEGNIIAAEVLLKLGADINARDSSGHTALMIAKSKGHIKIVELLKGADTKE